MKTAYLIDGSFKHQLSAGMGNENADVEPSLLRWSREPCGSQYTFYTDMCLEKAKGMDGKKVALLLEPPSLHDGHYKFAVENEDLFDFILTFREDLVSRGEKWLFYPFGGSWISKSKWGMHKKTKDVSIVVSQKTGAEGHKFRHRVVELLSDNYGVDVYGRGYNPIDSKEVAHQDYRYTIVVESWIGKSYFSEKIIDAMSMGCIPIYRGCPDISYFFNVSGLVPFYGITQLERILTQVICIPDYEMRYSVASRNIGLCHEYACCEDWIVSHYPWLFESGNGNNNPDTVCRETA